MQVGVCEPHQQQLSDADTEWLLCNNIDRRDIWVGDSLQELNEYILLEVPYIMGHDASRAPRRQKNSREKASNSNWGLTSRQWSAAWKFATACRNSAMPCCSSTT